MTPSSRVLACLITIFAGCTDSAAELLLTCEGGNTEACYADALAALDAARPDHTTARKLLSKACMPVYTGRGKPKESHPRACHALGVMVRDGKGGPRDLPRAAELFEIACRDEVADACVDLGQAVYDPPEAAEVEAEPARAVELFFNACNAVDPGDADPSGLTLARSCDALGRAYEEGKGVENGKKDAERAKELYVKACDAKHASGCVNAGRLAARQGRKGLEEAATLFERGCKLDARYGCFELAELHEEKKLADASPDKAAEFYQKTCNIDPTRGCYEAAQLMEKGLVEERGGAIESLYNLACEHGNAEACARRNLAP